MNGILGNGRDNDRIILPITSVVGWALRLFPEAADRPHFERDRQSIEFVVREVVKTGVFRRLSAVRACATTRSSHGKALRHSRADHSVAVAGTALALAWRLDLPLLDIECLVVAGLSHDFGHSMFSHQGEHVIGKFTGGHEAVGLSLIREDEEFVEAIKRLGLDLQAVVEIVSERGPIGTVMSIADTCGYLCLDSIGLGYTDFGFEEAGRFIRDAVHSVQGDLLVTHDRRLIEGFINLRAKRYADSYLSLSSRRRESALIALLKIVAEEIGMDEFVGVAKLGRDNEFWVYLPEDHPEVRVLLEVMKGTYPEDRMRCLAKNGPLPIADRGTILLFDSVHERLFDKALTVGVLGSKGEIERVLVSRSFPISDELRTPYVHYIDTL